MSYRNNTESTKEKKICSVAMATYNGAKYIEKQITSIINQTRRVDEIVISDDGSTDNTLEIVNRLSQSPDAEGIRFVILTDNPRHGFCGNFEHAISHCTGDYIFISDQDDVWLDNKVERVIRVFENNPQLLLAFHDGLLIDKDDKPFDASFSTYRFSEGKVSQGACLEKAVSTPMCRGMVMCISKELLKMAIPFPLSEVAFHDQWLFFCAMCKDGVFFLDEKLALYRLHSAQTSGGSKANKMGLHNRIRRIKQKIYHYTSLKESNDIYTFGLAIKEKLIECGLENTDGYRAAEEICEIGFVVNEAIKSNRFVGCAKLNKLYFNNNRYKKSGAAVHLYRIVGLLFRKKR